MSWQAIVDLGELREGEIHPVNVEGLDLIVLRFEGGVSAFLDRCPHEGAQLSLGSQEGDVLICARHLWEFDVRTGEHISRVRRREHDLRKVPARIAGGKVEVDVAGLFGVSNHEGGHRDG